MEKKYMVTFCLLLSLLFLGGCGDDGVSTNPAMSHKGIPSNIEYSDLSNYSITFRNMSGIPGRQTEPITTLALGLTAGNTDISNLEIAADLYINGETTPYKIYTTSNLSESNYKLTVDEIKANETGYLTIPLYLGQAALDRLVSLENQTECTISIKIDPDNKQSTSTDPFKERTITIIYLPDRLLQTGVVPSADRRFPPYSETYFDKGYTNEWGVPDIAQLHVGYGAAATWEPMSGTKIPFAAALECKSDVHANILWNTCPIINGNFYANANFNHLSDSGYKGSFKLFNIKIYDEERYLVEVNRVFEWAPGIAGNINPNELPNVHQFVFGPVVLTLKATIKGTYSINIPGDLFMGSAPWTLNQAFYPVLKTTLTTSIVAANIRCGISAPFTLTDAQMRAKLINLKVNPGKLTADADVEYPGDYTLLKGSIYITVDNKPKYKIFDYSLYDKSSVMLQRGFIHASRNGLIIEEGQYELRDRKW